MSGPRARAGPGGEAELAARWAEGARGPLRLEDGRALRVVFPGVPGGGSGPDFTGAILDAGGDLLRGDVEVHLRASGWRAHRHAADPAYGRVVLHVVGENDTGALTTLHASGRAIAVLVLRGGRQGAFPPPFTPPCALAARSADVARVLGRLGERRLRMKAARVAPLVREAGPGQALYVLMVEILGGAANRGAFGSLARTVPLAALLEEADGSPDRALAMTARLKGEAMRLALRRAGLRPMASPAARLEATGRLVARLWPGTDAGWPEALTPRPALPTARERGSSRERVQRARAGRYGGTDGDNAPGDSQDERAVGRGGRSAEGRRPAADSPLRVLRAVRVPGIGRETAIELAVNAVLPVALAGGAWDEDAVAEAWRGLPSPGTYGKLRRLEGWLGRPFGTAAALQGGLLLHADYCTKGMCGRCPVSEARG